MKFSALGIVHGGPARLYHLGARPVARSTLGDANASRPADLFEELFAHMAACASRKTLRHMADAVRILDATRIQVSSLHGDWLETVNGKRAIKVHIAYDLRAGVATAANITDQKTNDIIPARQAEIEPGMTYVFDLGYYDFKWWAKLDEHGCRFVTRLKSHTRLSQVHELPVNATDKATDGAK